MTVTTLDTLGDVFVALADPNRRAVLGRLAAAGEGTATTIARNLPISRQAVVKHLAHLDRVELVSSRRLGKEVRYRLRPERITATTVALSAIAADWDRTLSALKRVAEERHDIDD